MEIQESASLQLGSDVTKFRVAAAEVGRHFVSSCERAVRLRHDAGISHIAHTGRYICASFFSAFLSFSFPFFSPFSLIGEFHVARQCQLVLSPGAN